MRRKRSATKRLITLNPNKRLRGWLPPAPGWNTRRCILELAGGGQWFTYPALRKAHPDLSAGAAAWSLKQLLQLGHIERKHIEGRPTAPHWTHQDRAEQGPYPGMAIMRAKARWAYRVTESGLVALEGLRAGNRDIIGRARTTVYPALEAFMRGKGPMRRKLLRARLGNPKWNAVDWCRWNYGNPWPIGGGLWVWREWTVEGLFS